MAKANIKVTFPHSIENVWNVVTDLTNYTWRSDLSRIEIIDEKQQQALYIADLRKAL